MHKTPIPTICNYCSSDVHLVDNREIYGKSFGKWPMSYLCSGCGAYVGTHPNTEIPLGSLADRETREARKWAKEPFLLLTAFIFKKDRTAAYKWLSEATGIPRSKCHFGMFSVEQCELAHAAVTKKLQGR